MTFSLILCTVGRTDVLVDSIQSILEQTYRDFELIIVDQNDDDSLFTIIEQYKKCQNLLYIHSDRKGLSVNRNIGLSYARGQIIAFPDDDCIYPPETLSRVKALFDSSNLDFLTINIKGINSEHFFIRKKSVVPLNRYNFKPYAISIGIFVRHKDISDIRFDELLGAGQYFGSAEESDMVSNLIEEGYKGKYYGDVYVLHPIGLHSLPLEKIIARYKSYSLGYGAFMKKEIVLRKKALFLVKFLFELLLRLAGSFLPNKKRKFLKYSFIYQIRGFLTYKITR